MTSSSDAPDGPARDRSWPSSPDEVPDEGGAGSAWAAPASAAPGSPTGPYPGAGPVPPGSPPPGYGAPPAGWYGAPPYGPGYGPGYGPPWYPPPRPPSPATRWWLWGAIGAVLVLLLATVALGAAMTPPEDDPVSGSGWFSGEITGRPVLTEDAVVVPTEDGLLAIDRVTQDTLWEMPTCPAASWAESTPHPVESGVLVLRCGNTLEAYDPDEGGPLWTQTIPQAPLQVRSAARNTAAAFADRVDVYDNATGRRRWSRPVPADPPRALAVTADHVYVAQDGSLTALAAADGTVNWTVPLAATSLHVAGSSLLATTSEGRLLVLDADSGTTQADAPTGALLDARLVGGDQRHAVLAHDAGIVGLRLPAGTVEWRTGNVQGWADDAVAVATGREGLVVVDLATGRRRLTDEDVDSPYPPAFDDEDIAYVEQGYVEIRPMPR